MPYDLKMDLRTGDLVFSANRDFQGVGGDALVAQRIHMRLFVDRGSFLYDPTGTMGSRLSGLLRMPYTQARESAVFIIREALEPMEDIEIIDIDVFSGSDQAVQTFDPRNLLIHIHYRSTGGIEEGFVTLGFPTG